MVRGAEKLNAVYAVVGVPERIGRLRERYASLVGGLGHYEGKVERQMRELERINRGDGWVEDGDGDEGFGEDGDGDEEVEITEEDLRREEEEVRELERKKRELEERVKEMEKDLGGLLR
ncbi:hypothetical protein EG329_009644 [Mollisiaceae sp. DMI_Dod_QoI]|nr:hypothetical protein EG329_009644 [Helotiales sp. DMI_Dod_QoI]